MNDRQRVELMFAPMVLARCVGLMMDEEDAEILGPILAAFERTTLEPLRDVPKDRAVSLMRRARRVTNYACDELKGRTVAVAISATAHWLRAMIDAGHLELVEGPFTEAYERWTEAILAHERNAQLIDAIDRSASKAARRMHKRLQEQGLFVGVDPFNVESVIKAA